MRQPLAGPGPDASIGIRKERIAVAVVPDQPLGPSKISPSGPVKEIDSLVSANPDPPSMIRAYERDLLGVYAILPPEMFNREIGSRLKSSATPKALF